MIKGMGRIMAGEIHYLEPGHITGGNFGSVENYYPTNRLASCQSFSF